MPLLIAVLRSFCERFPRRIISWSRLLALSGANRGVVHYTLQLVGRGVPVLGRLIRIDRNVIINCARQGVVDIAEECRIESEVTIITSNTGSLLMMAGASIGPRSLLMVSSKWILYPRSKIASHCQIFSREPVPAPGKLCIGEGSSIGDHSLVDLSGDLLIGRNVSIGPYSIIYTHDHCYDEGVEAAWKSPVKISNVVVEDGAWIGTRVTILPGVRIGKMAVVAAGAVVTQDIPDHAIYAGIPAKPLRVHATRDSTN
jgi:acetyltransferase-like isoleucine patch superfamily enzyme